MAMAQRSGKSVGRVAGRIARGQMTIDGVEYRLEVNNGPNHLHGGSKGFANRYWEGRVETNRVVFSYVSEDMEQGYPGEPVVEAIYDFDDEDNLEITYLAKSSKILYVTSPTIYIGTFMARALARPSSTTSSSSTARRYWRWTPCRFHGKAPRC